MMHGLNLFDFHARQHDGARLQFTTVDPHGERYYSWSPYNYCANNPMRITDPTGMDWLLKEDEEIAKNIQNEVRSRDQQLSKEEGKITEKINKINNNSDLSTEKREKQLAQEQKKLENVQTQRARLSNLNEGITKLGESNEVYTFKTVIDKRPELLKSESGIMVIENNSTLGNRSHEITHAIQYENGILTYDRPGYTNRTKNRDMTEIEAFQTEYSINGAIPKYSNEYTPRNVLDINLKWLRSIKVNIGNNY